MAKGFDTSTPLSAAKAKQLAAERYEFVCRYLAPESWNSWKALTAKEAQYITDSGMWIVSLWETTAGAAAQGASAGRDAGIFALQAAREVGQPEGSKIYPCVDFEANESQFEAIADYFIAAKQELTGYELDGYGNDVILDYLKSRGIIRNGFQTIAWSYGRKSPGISIFQNDCGPDGNGFTMCGIDIDADESYGNEGWWNTMSLIQKSDANLVIGLLQEAYKQGITKITLPDGTVATVNQDDIHRLAEVQRTASGQATN